MVGWLWKHTKFSRVLHEMGENNMLSNIGVPGLILILVLALMIFGPSKLPEIGRAFGKTLKEFKNATKGIIEDEDESKNKKSDNVNIDKMNTP